MLELRKGDDILAVVGGINSITDAKKVIDEKLDTPNKEKIAAIKNEEALIKIANAISMCKPESVFIDTGSEADIQWIREHSLKKGEEKKLAKEGHTIHFDLPQDQARLVNQTYYIINEGEKMSSLAKSVLRNEALEYVKQYLDDIMQDKVMMVGFFS